MTPSRGRILVLDDNPVSGRVLCTNLTKAGHEVVKAVDGATALEALASAGADAIVADLGVAGGFGLQIVSEIRAAVEWSSLPVLVTSAIADPVIVREAGTRGVRRFLLKPIDMKALLGEIDEVLCETDRLEVLSREAAMKSLSLDGDQYDEVLRDLCQLIDEAEAQLGRVSQEEGAGEDDLEPWSDAMEAVRKLGGVVSSVAKGAFLDWDDPSGPAAARPSMDDWRRVAVRDLRTLRAQANVLLGVAAAGTAEPVPVATEEAAPSEPPPEPTAAPEAAPEAGT